MKKFYKLLAFSALLTLFSVPIVYAQYNLVSPTDRIGTGYPTALIAQKTIPGALPYIDVVGAKTVAFHFTIAGTIDSLLTRLEASADTSKGWTILDGVLGYTKFTATGRYSYYTDTADAFRYYRLYFVKDTADTTGRLLNVSCTVGWKVR